MINRNSKDERRKGQVRNESLVKAAVIIQRIWRGFLGRKESARRLLLKERAKRKSSNKKNGNVTPRNKLEPAKSANTANSSEISFLYNDDGEQIAVFKAVKKSAPINLSSSINRSTSTTFQSSPQSTPKKEIRKGVLEVKDTERQFESKKSLDGNRIFHESHVLSRIQEENTLRDSLENTRNFADSLNDSLKINRLSESKKSFGDNNRMANQNYNSSSKNENHLITAAVKAIRPSKFIDSKSFSDDEDAVDSLNGETNDLDDDEPFVHEEPLPSLLHEVEGEGENDLYQFMRTVEAKYNSSTPSKSPIQKQILMKNEMLSDHDKLEDSYIDNDSIEIKSFTVKNHRKEPIPIVPVAAAVRRVLSPKSTPKTAAPSVRDLIQASPRPTDADLMVDKRKDQTKMTSPTQLESAKLLYQQSVSRNIKQQQAM